MLDWIKQRISFAPRRNSTERALAWIENHRIPNAGISISTRHPRQYPEVTGYLIPTLYQCGREPLARQFATWLASIQNSNGGYEGSDSQLYVFDTGQIVRGMLAALPDISSLAPHIELACNWIVQQIQPDGRLPLNYCGDLSEYIHLYVLAPIKQAGVLMEKPEWIEATNQCLNYYKEKSDLLDFNMLSHFYGYIIEALIEVGEVDLAKKGLAQVERNLWHNGGIPAIPGVEWVCSTGSAQLALCWYKVGKPELGRKALSHLESLQNRSGGFYGSYGPGAAYFPDAEISWAVKYFLDVVAFCEQELDSGNLSERMA